MKRSTRSAVSSVTVRPGCRRWDTKPGSPATRRPNALGVMRRRWSQACTAARSSSSSDASSSRWMSGSMSRSGLFMRPNIGTPERPGNTNRVSRTYTFRRGYARLRTSTQTGTDELVRIPGNGRSLRNFDHGRSGCRSVSGPKTVLDLQKTHHQRQVAQTAWRHERLPRRGCTAPASGT